MPVTIKNTDVIRKALSSIEESLRSAYVKTGSKKLYVHKNSLYTDPNFTKIAGHFQGRQIVLRGEKKSIRVKSSRRSKRSKPSKSVSFSNTNNSKSRNNSRNAVASMESNNTGVASMESNNTTGVASMNSNGNNWRKNRK